MELALFRSPTLVEAAFLLRGPRALLLADAAFKMDASCGVPRGEIWQARLARLNLNPNLNISLNPSSRRTPAAVCRAARSGRRDLLTGPLQGFFFALQYARQLHVGVFLHSSVPAWPHVRLRQILHRSAMMYTGTLLLPQCCTVEQPTERQAYIACASCDVNGVAHWAGALAGRLGAPGLPDARGLLHVPQGACTCMHALLPLPKSLVLDAKAFPQDIVCLH